MKVYLCDKCGKRLEHSNRVHVYNYIVRKNKEKMRVTKPKRNDFDLCNKCRAKLIKWLGTK